MKILLFGKNGQVGWELQRSLAPLGELIALDRHSSDQCGDLSNLRGVAETIESVRPDVIVNSAAYTAVDKAESESEAARQINADAPKVMAEAAASIEAWLVHYSTDYVFDGSGAHGWREDDAVNPLSVYGETKLQGEQAIVASGVKHLIFRTSWVYAARGNNFAKTMLRLGRDRDSLAVIDDQIGAPTGAELIADVTAHAIRVAANNGADVSGIYHLAAKGYASWHEYAEYVLNFARRTGIPIKVGEHDVRPIPSSQYPTPARRPLNSRLNVDKLQTIFDLRLPDWRAGVERMLTEILEK